jgi:hypothetical protein
MIKKNELENGQDSIKEEYEEWDLYNKRFFGGCLPSSIIDKAIKNTTKVSSSEGKREGGQK